MPFLFFAHWKDDSVENVPRKTPSMVSVLRNRMFYLYFAAWLMFAFVDSFETVVVNHLLLEGSVANVDLGLMRSVEPVVAGLATVIAGAVSDWIGRKKVLIFGFVSLGIAYATLGLLPLSWSSSWWFFFVTEGVSIGASWILFLVVLWGDMSARSSEKYYAIGEIPFFLTGIFSLLLKDMLLTIFESSSFSLASFFLFLAVVPLVLAPETLPEKRIKDRELKMYVEKAMKVKEKYA